MRIAINVNGTTETHEVEARTLLVHYLRDEAGLTGTNIGCDTTSCGACTVLLNGESVKSCTVLAAQAEGTDVTTIEGLADADGRLHPVQQAFQEYHGLQCGYCTPGHGDGRDVPPERRTPIRRRRTSGSGWRAICAAAPDTTTLWRPPWRPPGSRSSAR